MCSSKTHATIILTLVLSFLLNVHGQGTTGDIEGTITDVNGALISGAVVKVESFGTTVGFRRMMKTNSNGYFIFAEIAPGTYKVTASATNFDDFSKNVEVRVDRSETVNVRLNPAGIVAQVNVPIDDSVTIDTTNTQIDTNVPQNVFEKLPKGTNFSSLLKVAPNVRPEPLMGAFGTGGFQIDGASGSENVFVIDGQEVTNFQSGRLTPNNDLPFELLQEIQVKSTGFEAEYGGAIGGIINAVTAGGNNDWHGNLGISFRPNSLQGRPNLFINSYGNGPGEFEYFRPVKDEGTHYFPVALLSGPILRDKVWGAFTYAPQIRETRRSIDYYTQPPNPANRTITVSEQYDATSVHEYAFARLDAQPIDSLRVYGTFLWNPVRQDGDFPSNNTWSNVISRSSPSISKDEYSNFGGRVNSNSFNTQATWTPLSWMVANFRAGRSFQNNKLNAYGRKPGTRFAVPGGQNGSPLDPCNPNEIVIPGGSSYCRGFNTGPNGQRLFDVSTRTTYDADVSFVGINAGGRHNIKAGWQFNRLFNDVDSGFVSGGYVLLYFGRPTSVYTGIPETIPICPDFTNFPMDDSCSLGTARIARRGTFGKAGSDNHALFVQDSWTINNRVTINYGLRAESEVVPSFFDPTKTFDINFGWGSKIAPRLGVAIDLRGDGKTKLFGSYGWFYDRFKYELPRQFFGGEIFQDGFAQILPSRGFTPFDYTLEAMLGGRGVIRGNECPITSGQTGYVECEFDRFIPVNSLDADPFAGDGAVDPNLEAMRQSEFTFGVEQELGNNFVLAARFTHKQLDQAIEDIGTYNDQGRIAYIIGNPGQGLACEIARSGNLPCTEEERKYDAIEIRIDKRATNYFFSANYTWSRLFGNYSGLSNSDRNGQIAPNITQDFDLPMMGWTANGEPNNGLLQTDRTHVFKAFGSYSFDWKSKTHQTIVSAYSTIQSGTPVTTIYTLFGYWTNLSGRGDLGRTEMFTETDLSIRHKYRFGRDNRFTFEPYIEIRNLFDERNEVGRDGGISNYDINIRDGHLRNAGCVTCVGRAGVFDTIFNRGGIEQFVLAHVNSNPVFQNNFYNQSWLFQAPRDVRFGFRFRF